MPTAAINASNVVQLTVDFGGVPRVLDFSLQRHHYRFSEGAASAPVNSILHHDVDPQVIVAEAVEVGNLLEASYGALNPATVAANPTVLYADFAVASGRTYRVDNSATVGWPNHFFVISGASVWSGLTRDDWLAAQVIRRLQVAVEADPKSQGGKLLDRYGSLRRDPTLTNADKTRFEVYSAMEAARTQLRNYRRFDDLKKVTGQEGLIKTVSASYKTYG
jgi:hypothetical protein